jgi:hypothetical protein
MNIDQNFLMKSTYTFLLLLPLMVSCGFFKDYSKDNHWSYFEEWDSNVDSKIDKTEFAAGCATHGYVDKKKPDTAVSEELFVKADENKDGVITGLEFYRWKIKENKEEDKDVASIK